MPISDFQEVEYAVISSGVELENNGLDMVRMFSPVAPYRGVGGT